MTKQSLITRSINNIHLLIRYGLKVLMGEVVRGTVVRDKMPELTMEEREALSDSLLLTVIKHNADHQVPSLHNITETI